jgi:hypothetical protein
MLNRYIVFRIAVEGILKQGEPAMKEGDNVCVYTNDKGNHCAIGWVMVHLGVDTSRYEQSPAGVVSWSLDDDDETAEPNPVSKAVGAENGADAIFLQRLQQCHDDNARYDNFIDMFWAAARQFARDYKIHDYHLMNDLESIYLRARENARKVVA